MDTIQINNSDDFINNINKAFNLKKRFIINDDIQVNLNLILNKKMNSLPFTNEVIVIEDYQLKSVFKTENIDEELKTQIHIYSCEFTGRGKLTFTGKLNNLRFYECSFNCKFELRNLKLAHLFIKGIKKIKQSIPMVVSENDNTFSVIDCEFKTFDYTDLDDFSELIFNNNIFYNKLIIHLNNCNANLSFKNCSIEGFISIQDSSFNTINIENVTFKNPAYFDDIEIKNIDKCSIKTIRSIKQQFQKTDNQIEYDRFKVYETRKYWKEISFLKKPNSWFILLVSYFYSYNGTRWIQSFIVTLSLSLIAFILLVKMEYNLTFNDIYKYDKSLFFNQFSNFLIPTNYNNPLIEKKELKFNNPYSILFFFLGKILLSIGIFETIKSFRKLRL